MLVGILHVACNPLYLPAAMIEGGVSVVGSAILVIATDGYNVAINKVFIVEIGNTLGIVFLVVAVVIKYVVK